MRLFVSGVLLLLLACASVTYQNNPTKIIFPGSEFTYPLVQAWADEYLLQSPDVAIQYDPMPSDDALQKLLDNESIIAAIDGPVSEDIYAKTPDLQLIPIAGSAVVPYYSFLQLGLAFNRVSIVQIFLGNITTWNDPRIQVTNPAAILSSANISVVYNIEDSFSNLALSQAMSSISPEWREKYGISRSFPMELRNKSNFYGAQGEVGMYTLARLLGNAVSYLSAPAMISTGNLVQYARVINKNGTRTDLRIDFTSPVLRASQALFDSRFTANIADLNLTLAYPIIGYSYLALRMRSTPPEKCSELKSVLQFLDYAINYTSPLAVTNMFGWCPLPPNIMALVKEKLYQVTCAGDPLLAPTTPAPAPAPDPYLYNYPLDTFMGLTTVEYVPFFNYLGSTISASQASTLRLSTITSLYEDAGSDSSSSPLRPSLFLPLLCLFLFSLFQMDSTVRLRGVNRTGAVMMLAIVLVLAMGVKESEAQMKRSVQLGLLFPFTGPNADVGIQMEAASRAALLQINPLDPNFVFTSVSLDEGFRGSTADAAVIYSIARYFVFSFVGGFDNELTPAMASLAESYLTTMISANARANLLSENNIYPLFTRVIPPYRSEGYALAAIVEYYGWGDKVAILASSDDYGVGTTQAFINSLNGFGYTPLTEERYFVGATDFSTQLAGIRESLARVIVVISPSASDLAAILDRADDYRLVGDQFVWLTGSPASSSALYIDPITGLQNERVKRLGRGMIGLRLKGGYGPLYDEFLDRWENLSPASFSGAGRRSIAKEAVFAYDAILLLTHALRQPFITLDDLVAKIRNANITGLTGSLNLNGTQDRLAIFDVVNLLDNDDGDNGWVAVGDWFEENRFGVDNGLALSLHPVFHDGTKQIPDLIIHNKLTYWSCEDKKEKTDETGKKVRLDPPGPDAENIAHKYRCDQFVDCYNMSDEWGCSPSLPAAYIALGILIGLAILFAFFCLLFSFLFGYVIKRHRVRTASPLFLIIMAFSCMVGMGSNFAYFGQDSKVSCPFRMWLVTLAIITMISSLFIKSFRVWRLYRAKSKILPMPDWQLLLLVVLMVIPVLIIDFLWTLIATPTASLIKVGGEYHYVCHAGGFTGDPIGYVFFALDCAYIGIILLFGVFLSIVTRNIISTFNESRLIAVSTYNLFFLGVIGIPVYLVIYQNNPLAAWVIYEVCVLYGFLSTLCMQFIPKIWGIVVIDKFKNTRLEMNSINSTTQSLGDSTSSNPNALF